MFSASRDAAFELIDAIASSPHASSAVAVSESPLMQRGYASVYKGLERMRFDEDKLRQVLVNQADRCGELLVEGYVIQALDHTPYPRRSAPTVTDRGFVHGANGQVVGHQYSLLGRVMHASGAWVGIEDCIRIPTCKTPVQVGAEQVARLRQSTPADRKYIITADSEYLTCDLLDQVDARIALLIRLKNNRVLFHRPLTLPPRLPAQSGQRPLGQRPLGRPTQHGQRVKLSDASTLGQPDQAHSMPTDDGGHVEISVFKDLHVRSHPQVHGCVIRIRVLDAAGGCKFPRPMWLFWSGRHDLDWRTFWRVYLKRFCLEAVHQFAKNALAWTSARLGNTDREERWSWLVMLAYWQLLLAAPLSNDVRKPWQKTWQKPTPPGRLPTPARVQRDYWRIFLTLGTPAQPSKPRGMPPGRPVGFRPAARPRWPVIHKSQRVT